MTCPHLLPIKSYASTPAKNGVGVSTVSVPDLWTRVQRTDRHAVEMDCSTPSDVVCLGVPWAAALQVEPAEYRGDVCGARLCHPRSRATAEEATFT